MDRGPPKPPNVEHSSSSSDEELEDKEQAGAVGVAASARRPTPPSTAPRLDTQPRMNSLVLT